MIWDVVRDLLLALALLVWAARIRAVFVVGVLPNCQLRSENEGDRKRRTYEPAGSLCWYFFNCPPISLLAAYLPIAAVILLVVVVESMEECSLTTCVPA